MALCLFYHPVLTIVHDPWKDHSLDYTDLCWQSNISAFQHTVREKQIRTMRYHFTPIRNSYYQEKNENKSTKCWWGCREIRTLVHCQWDCKMEQPLWKSIQWFLKKCEIELQNVLASLLLDIYPKELNAECQRDVYIHIHNSTSHNSKKVEATQCPSTDERMSKMGHKHTPEYYSAL